MEEFSSQSNQSPLELVDELNDWIRPLQKALTIEAENRFRNLYGRNEHFNSFVSREISSFRSPLLAQEIYEKIYKLAESFDKYPMLQLSSRRRLVIDARQFLYRLSKENTIQDPMPPPRLRLNSTPPNNHRLHKHLENFVSLKSYLGDVKGIGSKTVECLASLGLVSVKDLLLYFPRDYVDYSSLKRIISLEPGETATIVATIRRTNSYTSPRNRNLSIVQFQLEDVSGRIKATKFFVGKRFSNRYFLKKQESFYPKGALVAVSGLVRDSKGFGKSFADPLIEVLENQHALVKSKEIGRLLPVYHLTEGITAERIRNIIQSVISCAISWEDPLPVESLNSLSLMRKCDAIHQIHLPSSAELLKQAKRRLVFDEFLFLQLGLLRRRNELKESKAPELFTCRNNLNGLVDRFLSLLPFSLTKSQKEVLSQIESDLSLLKPMSRLVQGDVGSGKTVVAIATLLTAVESGWQGALMAPTEVLAHQHYVTLCKWMPQLHVTVELLTGSTPVKERKKILTDLATGNLNILVGTHALIEDSVSFFRLGLVVVDEQHRFGVNQRNLLINKGLQPHLLTMTATPIPRTLALSIHGDLDVSQINELPPGRRPVKTQLLSASERQKGYDIIKEEIDKGLQAYVVLPLVDESEKLELRSAIDVYEELSTFVFKNYKVGLLHGRMQSSEKKNIIREFSAKMIQVLVSTTVIEVGVDVPNATVMLIDHADRFGLAQLHQLRGRVGRGVEDSKCVLIDTANSEVSRNRLDVLVKSSDGFEIAEIDLRLRGPGQVLGTKQSGLPDFALANLVNDEDILECARKEASKILESDPSLKQNNLLRGMLDDYWTKLVARTQLN